MLAILAVFVILLVFGIGDMVATKTKAIVSMLFLASVVFLLGFWTGIFPETMFNDSTLLSVAGVLVTMLLVHMGTTIKLRDFADQWRTVLIAAVACIAISLGIYFIGGLLVSDKNYAIVGAPILSGGVVATLTMQAGADALGLPELSVFATLVMVVQGFVGYPVASLCLRSEAKRIRKMLDNGEELVGVVATKSSAQVEKKRLIPPLPEKYNGANIVMAKVALVAVISTYVANWINGAISNAFDTSFSISVLIFALIFGVLFKELGFLEEAPMKKAGADGFMLVVVTLSIFTNLASATPSMVAGMVAPLLIVVVIGSVTFLVISSLCGKLLGVSWQMSCAIGSTCLFGFPGTYIVTNEVCNAYAKDDEEKRLMLDHMMPKMLVAGMVSVSITSILIAGYMVNLLAA